MYTVEGPCTRWGDHVHNHCSLGPETIPVSELIFLNREFVNLTFAIKNMRPLSVY